MATTICRHPGRDDSLIAASTRRHDTPSLTFSGTAASITTQRTGAFTLSLPLTMLRSALALAALALVLLVACSATPTTSVLMHDYVNDRTPFDQVRGRPYNVGFNGRAVTVNGQNVLLQSGSIHYPRSTPEMWPHLMDHSRAAGLNTIQVYVFWNYHEAEYRQYDFTTENRNLGQFLTAAADAGLFVNLRIGPFVCAEWTFGGLPTWLRNGMAFRTNDTRWQHEMETFVSYITNYTEPWLARNGGPIILAQIENEYDNMEGDDAGHKEYVQWCGALTQKLDIGIPWLMCSSHDAPPFIINTCNGFYCDAWIDQHETNFPDQPSLWTEDWSGWFYSWGEAKPSRPAEDLAFAVARWVIRGGAHHNYYMYHGGTTWGRNTGGPQDVTSYDYDAPLDEYGYPHNPKYSHTAQLHDVFNRYAAYLLGQPRAKPQPLGRMQEAHVYGNSSGGLIGVSNTDLVDATVTFAGQQWVLPAWSVTLLDGATQQVLFQTSRINSSAAALPAAAHSMHTMGLLSSAVVHIAQEAVQAPKARAAVNADSLQHYAEPIGLSRDYTLTTVRPREQFNVTFDRTDYLWYVTAVNLTAADLSAPYLNLSLREVNEFVYVYMNGQPTVLAFDTNVDRKTYRLPTAGLAVGANWLQLLVVTMGMQNCCGGLEGFTRGLEGGVAVNGRDLTDNGWWQQPYLAGENSTAVDWQAGPGELFRPLSWYQFTIATPKAAPSALPSWQLDLSALGKGFIWFNGHPLGRYWDIRATNSRCEPCDYRGNYGSEKCRYDCGEPSLRLYHVPRAWLAAEGQDNTLLVLEERGGDPQAVALLQRN